MLIQPAEEIVVTGRALEEPAAERAMAVTVLDRQTLRSSPVTGLEQVLQQSAGLQLFRRSDARSANPTSQGVTLRALGGNAASRALLVLDGVPQTDPFGGWVYWNAYDPAALASVRITRGGGSLAEGPGALAGTIELTSAVASGAEAGVELGSRMSLDARVLAGGDIGSGRLTASARFARGDGFVPIVAEARGSADERAPYENASGRIRWVRPVGGTTELQASVSGFHDLRSRGLRFSDNLSRGADASVRLVGRGGWQWSLLGYGQWRSFRSSFAATDPARSEARRTSLQYDVPGRGLGWSAELRPSLGSGIELRLGSDGRMLRGSSAELGSYVAGSPTRDRKSGGRSGHAGVFAEAAWSAGDVSASLGGRIDRWWIEDGFFRERVLATGLLSQNVAYESRTGWLPTGRAAVEASLGGGVSVRGAAYLGWRLPTLNELFRPFRLGSDATAANPGLEPERLAGAEAGLRWSRGPARFEATAFHNRLRDPVSNVTLASGPGVFPGVGFVPAGGAYRQRQNLSAIRSTGIEADLGWNEGPWSAGLSVALVHARVRASGLASALDGLRPAQTPALTAAGRLGWERRRTEAMVFLRYAGPQFDDDLNLERLPAAMTVDVSGAIPVTPYAQLRLRVENLLDRDNAVGFATGGAVERSTPRTIWLGLRLMTDRFRQ